MHQQKNSFWDKQSTIALCCAMFVVFVVLVLRTAGVNPVVMADEYTYSIASRLQPLSKSVLPNYIYLGIYSFANICGPGYLECARILNCLFFVAAMPFIYLVSRQVVSANLSCFVAVLSAVGAVNSYTLYYMPEALYFMVFWVCIWIALRSERPTLLQWAVLGLACGISSLVKPHTLFVLPAFICLIFYSESISPRWVVRASVRSALFVGMVFLVKLSLGYMLAGDAGLSIFGSFYGGTLSSGLSGADRLVNLLRSVPHVLYGHVLALTLLFGIVIFLMLSEVVTALKRNNQTPISRLFVLTFLVAANLLAMVCLFTASVSGQNSFETANRLHMRYYNFIFPLFYIAAVYFSSFSGTVIRWWRMLSGFLVAVALIYVWHTKLSPYTPSLVDSPELQGFVGWPYVSQLLTVISFTACILLMFNQRLALNIVAFIFLPLSIIMPSLYINNLLRTYTENDAFERAGIYARTFLPGSDLDHAVVIGDDISGSYKTLFQLNNVNAVIDASINKDKPYDLSNAPSSVHVILSVGDVSARGDGFIKNTFPGFSIYRRSHMVNGFTMRLDTASWPGLVKTITGLHAPESWGTWSSGADVELVFEEELPPRFVLKITGNGFGPNVNQSASISIGALSYPLVFGAVESVLEVNISNPDHASIIKIHVPQPVSPKSLGLSEDERTLGVALNKIEVVPLK